MCAVAAEPQILRTKLYPPRLPEIVTRERLLRELEKLRTVKLATIIAGAGYGKSTLTAEFLQGLDRPFVWYQLEDTDSDLSEFLSYLVAGLSSIYPGFGQKTLDHKASVGNIREQSRAILSTLITELDELIGEEFYIVLDDFHLVNDSVPITEAVDFLLGHMLPNLHFIILSRCELNLALSRLRAGRELLELEEAELCFTAEETSRLFADIFYMSLLEEDITALSESTEGWISGLVLFYLALKDKAGSAVSAAIRESGVSLSEVFDYLSKTVYEGLPQVVKDFITRTSILSRMNPGLCNGLLGIDDAAAILSYLVSERMFTIPLDDQGQWFRYHHGLRAFLKEILINDCSLSEVEDLHKRAAALWESSEEPEQALYHYMEAGCCESAADVLECIVGQLMQDNRVSFLYREIFSLPEEILQDHPMLMLNGAQIAARCGDYDRVVAAACAAAEGFGETGGGEERALSLLRLAGAFFAVGRLEEAREMISNAREAMPPDSPYRCELSAVDGMISVLIGETEKADRLLEEAVADAEELEGTEVWNRSLSFCGMAFFLQGRLGKAVETLQSADRYLEKTGLTATHPFLYALLSRAHTYLDQLKDAKEIADKAVELGEEHSLAPMVFFNRAARAVAWACLGERDRALEDASISAAMCSQYEEIAQVAFAEWFLGETYGLLGKRDEALRHLNRGGQMVARYGDSRYIAETLVTAVTHKELGPERAIEEAERIIAAAKANAGLALSLAYSLLFRLKLAAEGRKESLEVLKAYIEDFGEDIILRWHTTDVEEILPVFSDLFASGKQLGYMDRVFSLGGAKSVPYLRKLEKSNRKEVAAKASELLAEVSKKAVDPLTVRMLGPFEVKRGEKTLTALDWKSKKALTAFKYLAANRDKGFLPRDVLMDLLWPEVPLESAQRNLNAALTAVRKTLEPEAGRGESSYLVSKGDSLRLELGGGGWTDLELLREKRVQAAKARELGDFEFYFRTLHEALDLYRGEFCAEDLYEDWCLSEREALKNTYVELVIDIATEHLRRGESTEALVRLEEAVAADPGREQLYRKQMTICSQLGNRAGIEEAFRKCSKHLWEVYEVSPSPETTDLYYRLREQ
jgi:LuxR family maltose regulon positive regulatory protein